MHCLIVLEYVNANYLSFYENMIKIYPHLVENSNQQCCAKYFWHHSMDVVFLAVMTLGGER